MEARQIVWATGRSWGLARHFAAKLRVHERRIAYLRFFAESGGGGVTLIEARPEGWWYTADLPGGRRVTACITDPQSARALALGTPQGWHRAVRRTDHVAATIESDAKETDSLSRPAGTVTLDPVCGPGWFAAGDAGFAADPLSSRGIFGALRSGIFAGYAAADAAAGKASESRARFAAVAAADFEAYRLSLARHYGEATRYSDQPFWRATAADLARRSAFRSLPTES